MVEGYHVFRALTVVTVSASFFGGCSYATFNVLGYCLLRLSWR